MFTEIKRLATTVLPAPTGKLRIFLNELGILQTKDESGVVASVGGSGGSNGAVPELLSNPTTVALEGKHFLFGDGPDLFIRKPSNGAVVQITDGNKLKSPGVFPFSTELFDSGTTNALVEGVINRYAGTSGVYPTVLTLPGSPTPNQEFWMKEVSNSEGATILDAGSNTIEEVGGAFDTLRGAHQFTGVKWDDVAGVWQLIGKYVETNWSTGSALVGSGSFRVNASGITRFSNAIAGLELLFPLGEQGHEVWLKETSLVGGFNVTLSPTGGDQIERTDTTLGGSGIVTSTQAGISIRYKYDTIETAWRIVSFYLPLS